MMNPMIKKIEARKGETYGCEKNRRENKKNENAAAFDPERAGRYALRQR